MQAIDTYNDRVKEMNGCVRQVLAQSVGRDLGPDRAAWEKWLVDLFGYSYTPGEKLRSRIITKTCRSKISRRLRRC